MKITFYANACCVCEQDGFQLLTDPWLVDGAFIGAWYHFPPLKTKPEDLRDVDALYISHPHSDHFDRESLGVFRRDIPIVILDSERSYLQRMLHRLGSSVRHSPALTLLAAGNSRKTASSVLRRGIMRRITLNGMLRT